MRFDSTLYYHVGEPYSWPTLFDEMHETTGLLDELGFGGVWLAEHHFAWGRLVPLGVESHSLRSRRGTLQRSAPHRPVRHHPARLAPAAGGGGHRLPRPDDQGPGRLRHRAGNQQPGLHAVPRSGGPARPPPQPGPLRGEPGRDSRRPHPGDLQPPGGVPAISARAGSTTPWCATRASTTKTESW